MFSIALAFVVLGVTANISAGVVSMARPDSELITLTGRVPLWRDGLLPYIAQRPLQGYGYGAFWTPQNIWAVSGAVQWPVMEANSAYVEMALNLGVVGLALFVAMAVTVTFSAVTHPVEGDGTGFSCRFRSTLLRSASGRAGSACRFRRLPYVRPATSDEPFPLSSACATPSYVSPSSQLNASVAAVHNDF